MTPLDLLLTSLAFLAGALGLWLVACFVIAAVVLIKPRGKMPVQEPTLVVKVDRPSVENVHTVNVVPTLTPEKLGETVSRQIAKAMRS